MLNNNKSRVITKRKINKFYIIIPIIVLLSLYIIYIIMHFIVRPSPSATSNSSISINSSESVSDSFSSYIDSNENVANSFEDFGFENMFGMTEWVEIDEYDIENNTVTIHAKHSRNPNYFASTISDLRFATRIFEKNHYYKSLIYSTGAATGDKYSPMEFSILDNTTITTKYKTIMIDTKSNVTNSFFIIETTDGDFIPKDFINWSDFEYNYNVNHITYKLK